MREREHQRETQRGESRARERESEIGVKIENGGEEMAARRENGDRVKPTMASLF